MAKTSDKGGDGGDIRNDDRSRYEPDAPYLRTAPRTSGQSRRVSEIQLSDRLAGGDAQIIDGRSEPVRVDAA